MLAALLLAGCVQTVGNAEDVQRAEAAAYELLALERGDGIRKLLAHERFDALVQTLPWYREQVGDCVELRLDEVRGNRVAFEIECPRGQLSVTVDVRKRKVRSLHLWGSGLGVKPEVARVAQLLVRVTHREPLHESIALARDPWLEPNQAAELEALARLEACEIERAFARTHELAFFVLECRNGGAVLALIVWNNGKAGFDLLDSGWDAWRHRLPAWTDPS